MNTKLISSYLQFLRKNHNFTQEELANRLGVSRQAVSKWETGASIPDLEVLLNLSKLYDVTINDILEPKTMLRQITDFEQIPTIPEEKLRKALDGFDTISLVTALMGASPETNAYIERIFPELDCESVRKTIGRVRIETVEDMQEQVLDAINFGALTNT